MRLSEITTKHVVKARRNASRPALGAGRYPKEWPTLEERPNFWDKSKKK